MKQINKLVLLTLVVSLVLSACKKFEETLERKDKESGIVNIIPSISPLGQAKTEEEITVLAKIGEPVQSLKFYIGNIEITPKTSKSIIDSVEDVFTDKNVALPMMQYTFDIPKNAKIGVNNVYFTINGNTRPPMALTITRPDILFPGKVTVYPFVRDIESIYLKDGPVGVVGINYLGYMTYDVNHRAFYFTDWYYEDPLNQASSPTYTVIRKVQDSIITTVAGGGNDPDAVNGKDFKVTGISAMSAGPDGALYFAAKDYYPLRTGGTFKSTRVRILKLDPLTGIISHVAGGKIRNGNSWTGYKDGKDSALLTNPTSLAFDKAGNLYFLDDFTLLRKVSPAGKVTTLLGKYDSFTYETVDMDTNEPLLETYYMPLAGHTDGFKEEALFQNAVRLVVAGNGKIYIQEEEVNEWQANIREVNIDTREVSTIIGLPTGARTFMTTGTFKEVELGTIQSFDVDFDGNIIYSTFSPYQSKVTIYKMDIQAETIALLAGRNEHCIYDAYQPLSGTEACFNQVHRIVFDQFGTLYVGGFNDIRKITIEK